MRNTITNTKATLLTIFTLLLMAMSANSQNNDSLGATLVFDGVESTKGTLDQLSGVQYGNTFVLKSSDEFGSRYLTVSINHQPTFKRNVVIGGAWSLVVIGEKGYSGTIYGDVVSGKITNMTDEKGNVIVKQTLIKLIATGATGNFEQYKEIAGNMQILTALDTLETKGVMFLKF